MFFLIFSNPNIQFAKRKFIQRFYTTAKILQITKKVEIDNKKKFVKVALDKNSKVFIIYITFLLTMVIYLAKKV